jgi:hypothetical protein
MRESKCPATNAKSSATQNNWTARRFLELFCAFEFTRAFQTFGQNLGGYWSLEKDSSGSSSGFHFRSEQIDFCEFGKKYFTKPNTRNPTFGNVQLTKNDRMPPVRIFIKY